MWFEKPAPWIFDNFGICNIRGILVRKKWGVTVEILKRGYLKLRKCVNERKYDYIKCSKNKGKIGISVGLPRFQKYT